MALRVKFLSEEKIESDAEALLREFSHARGISIRPPIPIDDIVEKHLGLSVDFDDLHSVLEVPQVGSDPDIFGAIWVDRRQIIIDQTLDPHERPNIEGRYRFTLAHEGGGHWRLHRAYLAQNSEQASFLAGEVKPAVICRSSEAKEPVEWQADFYASCILMPRKLVLDAWRQHFGSFNPVIFEHCRRLPEAKRPRYGGLRPIAHFMTDIFGDIYRDDHDYLFDKIAGNFTAQFGVSRQAMRIRLEKLGLLLKEAPAQPVFSSMN